MLTLAASLAALSRHPSAEAISRYARQRRISLLPVDELRVTPGMGLRGQVNGRSVSLGSQRFLKEVEKLTEDSLLMGASARDVEPGSMQVFVAVDGDLAGSVVCHEELRAEAPQALGTLAALGYGVTVLTGDRREKGKAFATRLGVPVCAGLLASSCLAIVADGESTCKNRDFAVGKLPS
jgi:Cu+-exporting ATPase